MEYRDLSPYEYVKFPLPMRCVGWLGHEYGVQGADEPPMETEDVSRLKAASRRLGSVMLGVHECEFCPEGSPFEGNGEYRYYMRSGEIYSAPMMVLHYVEVHGYRPPKMFRAGLSDGAPLEWDWRAERLQDVLLDRAADIDFRCEAIIDLANWIDSRAFDALLSAAQDEELVDIAGDEIGLSMGWILSFGAVKSPELMDFPETVRVAMNQVLEAPSR